MTGVSRLLLATRRGVIVACLVSAMAITVIGQGIPPTTQGPSPQSEPYVPTLTYDAVSVRECPPGPQAFDFENPGHIGRLRGKGIWAQVLVGAAYGVIYDRVVGGPDWVRISNEVQLFDVLATSDSATDDKLTKLGNHEASLEKAHMLQQLLEDRFKLKAHIETRDRLALTLLVAKTGPRMQTGEPPPSGPPGEQGPGPLKPFENIVDSHGVEIVGHGRTMGQLARLLELWLRKSVVDQTGLTGTFNFDFKFNGMLSDMASDDGSKWPPIEDAIRALGLELKSANVPQRVVVIDHIEMPTPN